MPAFSWPTFVHPAARDPFVGAIVEEAFAQGLDPGRIWGRLLKILGEEKYHR